MARDATSSPNGRSPVQTRSGADEQAGITPDVEHTGAVERQVRRMREDPPEDPPAPRLRGACRLTAKLEIGMCKVLVVVVVRSELVRARAGEIRPASAYLARADNRTVHADDPLQQGSGSSAHDTCIASRRYRRLAIHRCNCREPRRQAGIVP